MRFDWNHKKAESNLKKHGISFQEAATKFGDALSITYNDPDHSTNEYRLLTLGLARTGKMLIVSHIGENEAIRIISVRLMTRKERQIYEEDYERE